MDPPDLIAPRGIRSHVAKQSLSTQDRTSSVVRQRRRLELAETVGFQVSAGFHFLFLYLSLFRIAVICLVMCKEGSQILLQGSRQGRSNPRCQPLLIILMFTRELQSLLSESGLWSWPSRGFDSWLLCFLAVCPRASYCTSLSFPFPSC